MFSEINVDYVNIIQHFFECNEPTAFKFYFDKVLPYDGVLYIKGSDLCFESKFGSSHLIKKSNEKKQWRVDPDSYYGIDHTDPESVAFQNYLIAKKIHNMIHNTIQNYLDKEVILNLKEEINKLKRKVDYLDNALTQIVTSHEILQKIMS